MCARGVILHRDIQLSRRHLEEAVTGKEHNSPTDRVLEGSISLKGRLGSFGAVKGRDAPIKWNTKDDYYMTRSIGSCWMWRYGGGVGVV